MNRRDLFKMAALAFAGTTDSLILESKPEPEKALKVFKERYTPWSVQCGKSELALEQFKALMDEDTGSIMYIVPRDKV